jgi:hypothetical protein
MRATVDLLVTQAGELQRELQQTMELVRFGRTCCLGKPYGRTF